MAPWIEFTRRWEWGWDGKEFYSGSQEEKEFQKKRIEVKIAKDWKAFYGLATQQSLANWVLTGEAMMGTDPKLQICEKLETVFWVKIANNILKITPQILAMRTKKESSSWGVYRWRDVVLAPLFQLVKEQRNNSIAVGRSRVGVIKRTKEKWHSLCGKLAVGVIQATGVKFYLRRCVRDHFLY